MSVFPVYYRFECDPLLVLADKPVLADERHLRVAARARDGAAPEVGHGHAAVGVGRVELAQLLARTLQHPVAPIAHIGGKRVPPIFLSQLAPSEGLSSLGVCLPDIVRHGLAGWLAVFLGVLQGTLEDEDGDRVEVASLDLTAQAQPFKGDSAAAGEGVEQSRWLAPVAVEDSLSCALQELGSGKAAAALTLAPHDLLRVADGIPTREVCHLAEERLTLGVCVGIIHE